MGADAEIGNVLEGIRVLDFGRYIAGPYCATMLGDLGAEVIRIEKVAGSEDRYVAPVGDDGAGALFLQMGRNKRGMTLDPMKPEGRRIVEQLVATADVVVANLPGATLAAMGLDYDSLKAIKADIILTTASAFGSRGPYAERVGFDGIGQAMGGAVYLSGAPDAPVRAVVPYVDFGTALYSTVGTLAALMERRVSGKGQRVEASLLGTSLSFNNATLIEQAVIEANRVATHNRGQTAAPVDIFPTRDGRIIVQVVGNPLFQRWARLMGEEHWLTDPRFADDLSRGENGEIVSRRMAAWCAERTNEACLAELEAARIPAGPVLSPQGALDDPHVRAAEYFQPLDYPGLPRPAPVSPTPVGLSRTPATIRHRAPTLGEHTEAILAELGYQPGQIAQLRSDGVV